MYWHQSVTPNTMTDPMQAKIFKLLPLLFTIFLNSARESATTQINTNKTESLEARKREKAIII
ncbi:hypothetical protein, partial [Helicobacter pylori]|uniref:hypothetical protein n=1 Tax=Helicobacter pylori TaxID=210 RepID=UPI0015FF550A